MGGFEYPEAVDCIASNDRAVDVEIINGVCRTFLTQQMDRHGMQTVLVTGSNGQVFTVNLQVWLPQGNKTLYFV